MLKHAVFIAIALLAAPTAAHAAKSGWAVFDAEKAMSGTKAFKQAKAELEKRAEARKVKLEAAQKKIEAQREELQAKRAVAAGNAFADEERALLEEQQKLGQQVVAARRELAAIENVLKKQLFMRFEVALQEVAAKGDYDYVFHSAKVLYSIPKLDITDDVVKAYNKRFNDEPLDMSVLERAARASAAGPGPGAR